VQLSVTTPPAQNAFVAPKATIAAVLPAVDDCGRSRLVAGSCGLYFLHFLSSTLYSFPPTRHAYSPSIRGYPHLTAANRAKKSFFQVTNPCFIRVQSVAKPNRAHQTTQIKIFYVSSRRQCIKLERLRCSSLPHNWEKGVIQNSAF
jgi:hypothetical protein